MADEIDAEYIVFFAETNSNIQMSEHFYWNFTAKRDFQEYST